MIATGYVPCEQTTIAVAVLSIAVGLNGLHFTGALVNHVDIAPPFAGVLFGISNTMATIPGFVAPYVVKVVTRNVSIYFLEVTLVGLVFISSN